MASSNESIALSSIDTAAMEKILKETDPEKLHQQATEMLSNLEETVGKSIRMGFGESALTTFGIMLQEATFVETRAIYYSLHKK